MNLKNLLKQSQRLTMKILYKLKFDLCIVIDFLPETIL